MLTFELKLTNGHVYQVECGREEMDVLIEFIGEESIDYVEEL